MGIKWNSILKLIVTPQIGQRHKGFIGMFEETLSKCAHHIWFERSESKDRQIITQRYMQCRKYSPLCLKHVSWHLGRL